MKHFLKYMVVVAFISGNTLAVASIAETSPEQTDGKLILLYPNGQWKYAETPNESKKIKKNSEEQSAKNLIGKNSKRVDIPTVSTSNHQETLKIDEGIKDITEVVSDRELAKLEKISDKNHLKMNKEIGKSSHDERLKENPMHQDHSKDELNVENVTDPGLNIHVESE